MADVTRHRGGGVTRSGERWRARLWTSGTAVSLGYYATREEAQAAIDAALATVDGGATILGAQTVGEWGAEWLRRREVGGRVAGVARELSAWRTHVASHLIAELPLRALSRAQVARWLDHLAHTARATHAVRKGDGMELRTTDRPLGRQTILHALRLLRGSLQAAVDAGLIEANVARDLRAPRRRAEESEGDGVSWTWLTLDEIATVLTATSKPSKKRGAPARAIPERHRLCWTVAIYTGLRRGELRALQWRDVVLDDEAPRVLVRKPKSRKSREVPLLPPAHAALRRLRELEPGIGPAHVFRPMRSLPGEPLAGRMGADWDLGWRAHGPALLGRAVRPHDLRHTCASHLVQGNWGRVLSLYEVMAWMGHGNYEITKRYAHLAPEGLRGVAAEMAGAFASATRKDGER